MYSTSTNVAFIFRIKSLVNVCARACILTSESSTLIPYSNASVVYDAIKTLMKMEGDSPRHCHRQHIGRISINHKLLYCTHTHIHTTVGCHVHLLYCRLLSLPVGTSARVRSLHMKQTNVRLTYGGIFTDIIYPHNRGEMYMHFCFTHAHARAHTRIVTVEYVQTLKIAKRSTLNVNVRLALSLFCLKNVILIVKYSVHMGRHMLTYVHNIVYDRVIGMSDRSRRVLEMMTKTWFSTNPESTRI